MDRAPRSTPFAKKSFGQNFLIDRDYVEKIVNSLDLTNNDTVLEIGPGRGALTERLVESAKRVIAVELDRDMIGILRHKFPQTLNLTLVEADILKIDFDDLLSGFDTPIKLVANLPYYISTAVLQHLISQRSAFSEMTLMFQREVADRISAPAGSTDRGFLTVLLEAYMEVERLFDVPPRAFKPVPKVWSSVVRLRPKEFPNELDRNFVDLVSLGFSQKRKTLLNNLKENYADAVDALLSSGIDAKRRAETLTIQEWVTLANELLAS